MAKKGYYTLTSFGQDRDFLCRDRAFRLCVATWFSMSQHSSQAAGGCWVATGVFLVVQSYFILSFCHDMGNHDVAIMFWFSVVTEVHSL